MKKVYLQPNIEVLGYVHASTTLMGSLGSNLKHPEDSGLQDRTPGAGAPKRVF